MFEGANAKMSTEAKRGHCVKLFGGRVSEVAQRALAQSEVAEWALAQTGGLPLARVRGREGIFKMTRVAYSDVIKGNPGGYASLDAARAAARKVQGPTVYLEHHGRTVAFRVRPVSMGQDVLASKKQHPFYHPLSKDVVAADTARGEALPTRFIPRSEY